VPRAVVVPVQPELAVQLLAVVLEALHVAVRALREQGTVGIVVVVPFGHVREKDLLHASALGNYYTIVSLMVLQVEMVDGVSGTAEGEVPVSHLLNH